MYRYPPPHSFIQISPPPSFHPSSSLVLLLLPLIIIRILFLPHLFRPTGYFPISSPQNGENIVPPIINCCRCRFPPFPPALFLLHQFFFHPNPPNLLVVNP